MDVQSIGNTTNNTYPENVLLQAYGDIIFNRTSAHRYNSLSYRAKFLNFCCCRHTLEPVPVHVFSRNSELGLGELKIQVVGTGIGTPCIAVLWSSCVIGNRKDESIWPKIKKPQKMLMEGAIQSQYIWIHFCGLFYPVFLPC
jgi:hypothetical protein